MVSATAPSWASRPVGTKLTAAMMLKLHFNMVVTRLKQPCRNFAQNSKTLMTKQFLIFTLCTAICGMAATAEAVAQDNQKRSMKIGGTLRSKYEYQTSEGEGRFQVRTARVNVSGTLSPVVSYKAEIDLCDEGKIKMLDAYTTITPSDRWALTIGQMRVPFTIDAHRSPHQQYFANRSFIAKQVGNIRDVGAKAGYNFRMGFPVVIEAGLYNGSGLTDQKDYWTKGINFSAKMQAMLPVGLNVVLSAQKIKPEATGIMMYDAGLNFHRRGWVVEAEYLYKHYDDGAFKPVHAVDAFVNYDIAMKKGCFTKISPLLRYDHMTDHSDGHRYLDGKKDEGGSLIVNDYRRSRVTGGVTLSLDKPFVSDIRINYEKYFYATGAIAKPSERDKIVIEVVTHF